MTNDALSVVSVTGERSPNIQGVNRRRLEPGSTFPTISSSTLNISVPPPSVPRSSGVASSRANHSRHTPAVSDSPSMMNMEGSGDTIETIPFAGTFLGRETDRQSQLEVPR